MREIDSYQFNRWQKLLARFLGMHRIDEDCIYFSWGWFSLRFGLALYFNYSYDENRPTITFCPIWGKWVIHIGKDDLNYDVNHTPEYGFYIFENTFYVKTGYGGTSWDFPFFTWCYKHREILEKNQVEPYCYKLESGEVQNTNATIDSYSRTLHRKWFPFLTETKRFINVTFDRDIGERVGMCWKGGVVSCSHEMLPDETMVQALRRMEKHRKFK